MLGRAVLRTNVGLAVLVAVAAAVFVGGCTRAHDCRPGTLFLNVQFSPYTGVKRVFVQVAVTGETTRSMTFDVRPPGAESGSVEVDFATYPAGKRADVLVRLEGASGDLATRSIAVDLPGSCAAVDVSFSTTDGGGGAGGAVGGRGGATGTGGAAGTGLAGAGGTSAGGRGGGAAGTIGVAGTGGGAAGTVGAGGRGGSATGGSGGAAGTVGVAGAAGTGSGGRGGSAAGTSGGAGSGGRGGAGGTIGVGGRGGCAPTGETCFNNLDDDCDGNVDCMDSDCNAVALCVALDPALGTFGVMVPDAQTPCPPNYTTMTTINRAPVQAQCSGCLCSRPPVNCVASVYDYPSYAQCMTDPSSQTMVSSFSSGFACTNPNWHTDDGYVAGVGLGPLTPMYPGCTASGTATAGTPTWAATTRFCATTMRGGGCGTGSVCLPAITNNPQRCVMAAGSNSCPAGTQRSDWYTGVGGNFACNPCSCGEASGASCSDVRLFVGSNASCSSASMFGQLAGGQHLCTAPGILFDPSIVFSGQPTSPTCPPQYTTSGSLMPTGPQTVCCR